MQTARTTPHVARERRQKAVLRLVQTHTVKSQSELAELLADEGLEANQATLSRDLRELGLVKGPEGYAVPQDAVPADDFTRAVAQWLKGSEAVEHQVVLKTPPGGAPPLGLALDRAALDGVAGTIAGDDTVLVICRTKRIASRLARQLRRQYQA